MAHAVSHKTGIRLIVRRPPPQRPIWLKGGLGFHAHAWVHSSHAGTVSLKQMVVDWALAPISHTGSLQPFEHQEVSMFLPVYLEETEQYTG